MKKLNFIGVLFVLFAFSSYGQFIQNEGQLVDFNGQTHSEILYYKKGNGFDVYFTKRGVSYIFSKSNFQKKDGILPLEEKIKEEEAFFNDSTLFYRMDMVFLNSSDQLSLKSDNVSDFYYNFYLPHCQKGIHEVPTMEKIIYNNVYDNIDIQFYLSDNKLKYDIVLNPGADIRDIQFMFEGAENIELLKNELLISSPVGKINESLPYSYTIEGGNEQSRKVIYKLDKNIVGFDLEYNRDHKLVIDPQISWSTFYDFSDIEESAEVRGEQFVIVDGSYSTTLPTLDPGGSAYFQNTLAGSNDMVILKFDTSGVRQWATYYGGTSNDSGRDVGITSTGDICVVGYSQSSDIPKLNPGGGAYYDGTYTQGSGPFGAGSYDMYACFITKFNSSGQLLWGTHYDFVEFPILTVDNSDNLYVIGRSEYDDPADFALAGAYNQPNVSFDNGGGKSTDMFLIKFNSANQRIWATNLGGDSDDIVLDATTDNSDNLFIMAYGDNYSGTPAGFVKQDAGGVAHYDALLGDNSGDRIEVLLYKFSPAGVMNWGTAYGGSLNEYNAMGSITTDNLGNIFIAGGTRSTDLPIVNPGGGAYFDGTKNTTSSIYNTFLTRFSPSLEITWGTYFGGAGSGTLRNHIRTTNDNKVVNVLCAGSNTFPIVSRAGDYNQSVYNGGNEIHLAEFSTTMSLDWASYLGASTTSSDWLGGVGITDNNAYSLFVAGRGSDNTGYPLLDPGSGAYFDNTNNTAGFITKFSPFVCDNAVNNTSTLPICDSDTKPLAGTPAGGTWSIVSGGGSITGTTYTPPTVSTATTVTVQYSLAAVSTCPATSDDVSFTVNPVPNFTITSTDPTTCSGSDGTIILSGLENGTTYNVSHDGGAIMALTTNASGELTITGLTAGTYTSFIVELNGCSGTDNTVITLNDPTPPSVDAGTDQIVCNGDQVTLTATNPSGAAISWDNGVTDGVSFTPPLGTTTYTVTATLSGCAATDQVNVQVNPTPTVSAGPDTNVCAGNQIALTATNPDGATISWSGGITDGVPFSPPAGTTTYIVTADLSGCPNTDQVDVTLVPNPTFTVTYNDPTTCGGTDGEIIISGLNANESYEVGYNGGALTAYISDAAGVITVGGLGAGSYTNIVVEQNGCSTTDSNTINLIEPGAPNISAGTNQFVCDGDQVTLTATNPDGATISWDNGVIDGTPFTPPVGTTTYTVTGDLAGCTATSTVDVTVTEYPTFTLSSQDVTSCGANDGQIIISGLNANTGYNIVYDGNGPTAMNSDATGEIIISGLAAGNYTGFDVSLNGCSTTDNAVITIIDYIDIPSLSAGEINCDATNGTYSITFYTDNSATVTSSAGSVGTNEITGIPLATNVTITASYGGACETTLTVQGPTDCPDECVFPNLSASQGVCEGAGTYSVVLSETTGAAITVNTGTVTGNVVNGIPIGSDLIITAANGTCTSVITVESPNDCTDPCENPAYGLSNPICSDSTEAFASINFVLTSGASITTNQGTVDVNSINNIPTNTPIMLVISLPGCDNDTVYFDGIDCSACNISEISVTPELIQACLKDLVDLNVENPNNTYTYSWYHDETLVNTGSNYTFNLTDEGQTGDYIIVAELGGPTCQTSDTVTVAFGNCEVVVSEAVTPNGDGFNDALIIENLEAYPNTSIVIFNRWGSQVYQSEDYQNDWNGISESALNVGGNELPEGSYYYIITLGGEEDDEIYGKIIKGYFYIKR